ncbi:MAG: XRE family transcriptional regulator [Candidatus Accumulibacter phosphatis]|jgi:Zn-dependent peptidase ImmA (M78 family)/DNA-binding XRE family transcriptional regulator|uniref:helix-turn-helix domain-containing protein n=1 Tax=Candidatus Accumulibacter sp. ACC012 TaxID=2823332 RepID=UPI0025C65636|nr:XRE family transcriptional regulator [Candidatus Accumulibacter sp. ACC012]
MIGDRIRQARLAAGLTLGALGDKVGVTHTAIQKYEKGTMTPPSSQLLKLARACGIRVEYFFRTHKVELLEPEFRKLATFGKAAQEALKIKVLDRIEKRVELLGFFPESPLLRFDSHIALPERVTGLDQLEGLADQVRDAWKLGLNPIGDLTDTLETRGLLVIVVDEENSGFSGLTAMARTLNGHMYPVVAVSSRWPGDRQRFTLAHELGHLLLSGRLDAQIDEEKACDRFAGAFLAPKAAAVQLLGQSRRGLEWQELYALKHEFGLSMAGWLQRAKQCGVITNAVHLAMWRRFSSKGWRKAEPGDPVQREHPRLFEQLVYRALGEQYVSESKAAELLGIPMMRFHKERQLESVDAAAHQ